MKERCSLILAVTLALVSIVPVPQGEAEAAGKAALSARRLEVTQGTSKVLKVSHTRKKVSWKLSTKKYVKTKRIGKASLKITGKKAGITKITAKAGKKKFVCKVTVKKKAQKKNKILPSQTTAATMVPSVTAPVTTPKATAMTDRTASPTTVPDAGVPVRVSKKALNQANESEEILKQHTGYSIEQKVAEGIMASDEQYISRQCFYLRQGDYEEYIRSSGGLVYDDFDNNGTYRYSLMFPIFPETQDIMKDVLGQRISTWSIGDSEEILSCVSKDGKIYLQTKLQGSEVKELYGSKCDGKEGVYAQYEAVLDENSLELIQNKEYLCDKNGNKEWMETSDYHYDEKLSESVEKMAVLYEKHIQCKDMPARRVTITLETGTTKEKQESWNIPKGDAVSLYLNDEFYQKYEGTFYTDEACTQLYKSGSDDRQGDLVLYCKSKEEELPETGGISYADGVSGSMTKPDFWANLSEEPDRILATDEQICSINKEIQAAAGTKMNDLKNIPQTYNGITLRSSLANSVTSDANRKNYYANGNAVDKDAYFNEIKNNIVGDDMATEKDTVKYAVCTTRTEVKWCPTSDYIGYSATDTDDESVNSAIGINDPMILEAKTADGKFYWGYTENCTGWVAASDVAICNSREEWLDAWDVEAGEKDFLVVTTDRIVTETSFYNPSISGRILTLGTRLRLVPQDQIPASVDGRGSWNNYVVYLPVRSAEGKYEKKMALISEHSKVNAGYLPLTERNLLQTAFECLGNRYGWGGSVDAMDCSLYASMVYRCFGFSLPRNTSWQQLIPSLTKLTGKTDQEKTCEIKKVHVGSILYFQGHEMLYLGRYKGRTYVISALGSLVDGTDTSVRTIYSVAINTLDARRKNGSTWLTNLTGINSFDKTR